MPSVVCQVLILIPCRPALYMLLPVLIFIKIVIKVFIQLVIKVFLVIRVFLVIKVVVSPIGTWT